MTDPLILAKLPGQNPRGDFARLPFENWNECPDTPDLMAAANHWSQQHGAVPAAMRHDGLEPLFPEPPCFIRLALCLGSGSP